MSINLNRRCRIEYKTTTQDATYGSEVVTWTLLAVAWCELRNELPSKSEQIRNGVSINTTRSRLRMRYRTDIDSSMRIILDGVTYQIIGGPVEFMNKQYIECMLDEYSS